MLRASRSERGHGLVEVACWAAAAGLVLAITGYVLIARPGQAKTPKLTAEQQAYVEVVATQQAETYVIALATQQALREANRPAAKAPEPSRGAQILPTAAPKASPPQQRATRPQDQQQQPTLAAPTPRPAPQPTIAPPPPPSSPPSASAPVQLAPAQSLTRYDLIDYAYSRGCNGSECTCVADTLLQHFTLDQISRQGIAASAAMISADVSKCFDSRYNPDPLPTSPLPTPDPSCVPC